MTATLHKETLALPEIDEATLPVAIGHATGSVALNGQVETPQSQVAPVIEEADRLGIPHRTDGRVTDIDSVRFYGVGVGAFLAGYRDYL